MAYNAMMNNAAQNGMMPNQFNTTMQQPQINPLQTPNKNFWGSTPGNMIQSQKFSPYTSNIINQILGKSYNQYQNTDTSFEPIEQHARQMFNEQTVPSLAERFTSMGGEGGQRSSAFAGILGQAGAGLESQLGAMKGQYNLQLMPELAQLMQMGMTPQTEQSYMPGQQGAGQSMAGPIAGGVASIGTLLAILKWAPALLALL